MELTMLWCHRCKQTKPLDDFGYQRYLTTGTGVCRVCYREEQRNARMPRYLALKAKLAGLFGDRSWTVHDASALLAIPVPELIQTIGAMRSRGLLYVVGRYRKRYLYSLSPDCHGVTAYVHAATELTRHCPSCGATFDLRSSGDQRRYCSVACRRAAYYRRCLAQRTTLQCRICHQDKPLDDFAEDCRYLRRGTGSCRACWKAKRQHAQRPKRQRSRTPLQKCADALWRAFGTDPFAPWDARKVWNMQSPYGGPFAMLLRNGYIVRAGKQRYRCCPDRFRSVRTAKYPL